MEQVLQCKDNKSESMVVFIEKIVKIKYRAEEYARKHNIKFRWQERFWDRVIRNDGKFLNVSHNMLKPTRQTGSEATLFSDNSVQNSGSGIIITGKLQTSLFFVRYSIFYFPKKAKK